MKTMLSMPSTISMADRLSRLMAFSTVKSVHGRLRVPHGVSIARRASSSHRSFSGTPAWPATLTKVTSAKARHPPPQPGHQLLVGLGLPALADDADGVGRVAVDPHGPAAVGSTAARRARGPVRWRSARRCCWCRGPGTPQLAALARRRSRRPRSPWAPGCRCRRRRSRRGWCPASLPGGRRGAGAGPGGGGAGCGRVAGGRAGRPARAARGCPARGGRSGRLRAGTSSRPARRGRARACPGRPPAPTPPGRGSASGTSSSGRPSRMPAGSRNVGGHDDEQAAGEAANGRSPFAPSWRLPVSLPRPAAGEDACARRG